MLELAFCDSKRARELNCATCPTSVKKLRKCETTKEDYNENDAAFWPMRVVEGGAFYGFCPAKVLRDVHANRIFNLLTLTAECGTMYTYGGMSEQPEWFFELAAWFVPRYHDHKFASRAKMILGDGKQQIPKTRK